MIDKEILNLIAVFIADSLKERGFNNVTISESTVGTSIDDRKFVNIKWNSKVDYYQSSLDIESKNDDEILVWYGWRSIVVGLYDPHIFNIIHDFAMKCVNDKYIPVVVQMNRALYDLIEKKKANNVS